MTDDSSAQPPLAKVPRVFRHVVLTFTSNARSLSVLIDKKTRDKAVRSLAKFLSESHEKALPKPEMAKLWKGIFYCALFFDSVLSPCSAQAVPGYWMSDKPLVSTGTLVGTCGSLLLISSTESALAFLAGFWEAIVREWNGIDRLRMDKYYNARTEVRQRVFSPAPSSRMGHHSVGEI